MEAQLEKKDFSVTNTFTDENDTYIVTSFFTGTIIFSDLFLPLAYENLNNDLNLTNDKDNKIVYNEGGE